MSNPSNTYRIQFHKEFTFKDLDQIIPYLKELGVQTIYASPIFAATPGSTHGYDVVNPHQINPEIGTEEELFAIAQKLKALGISWLQDIVPNHMAYHSNNAWLMDVLENWKDSPFFNVFDINFPTPSADQRLMVPFLGEELAAAISDQKIRLEVKNDKIYLCYADHFWPLNAAGYLLVNSDHPDAESFRKWIKKAGNVRSLQAKLDTINKNSIRLQEVIDAQYYRPCFWRETEQALNYRRFFTVNGLICLNIQYDDVFELYHQYIFKLLEKGVFQGLRIDHVDGLADPGAYLNTLRKAVGPDIYIVVEKILALDEQMPKEWPVQGNTGYDFLAIVNNLFTNRRAEKTFNKLYQEVTYKKLRVADQILLKKRAILYEHMQGELAHLVQLFSDLQLADAKVLRSLPENALAHAIGEFLIHCPVYRFYGNQFPLPQAEQKAIRCIFERADQSGAGKLLEVMLLSPPKSKMQAALTFYQRCMQFSGPLMAKGVEDTLMYTYNRFIGHTEVGDAPDAFGLSVPEFHQKMTDRALKWPLSMNGTSTHDTKRGEDVRARLNVLTDLPEHWRKIALQLYRNARKNAGGPLKLHRNDAYLIFQTLLGALPLTEGESDDMADRLELYVEKALREAKKRSDWAVPNETYEHTAKQFITSLLDKHGPDYTLLRDFLHRIADFSLLNSLSQLLLKFTCPGIPDIYQGTELWDLSLVDPDNRRPVDYTLRHQLLKALQNVEGLEQLWETRQTGQLKLWLTQKLAGVRSAHREVFENGDYIPLQVKGTYHKNVLAFLRKKGKEAMLIAVPLGLANLSAKEQIRPGDFNWRDTYIQLPKDLAGSWENLLTGEKGQQDVLRDGIDLSELFSGIPLAMISLTRENANRGSGILLAISSLPSGFGIGDLGQEAYEFVDFLAAAKQSYWQLLPLNPTSALESYSPYSAFSAMAGNSMLISLELLAQQQLLEVKKVKAAKFEDQKQVDYKKATLVREELLHQAFLRFNAGGFAEMENQFENFCREQSFWLTDFSQFVVLRKHHQLMPWSEWPEPYKLRKKNDLQLFTEANYEALREVKWQQFMFFDQWQKLRTYANSKGIQLIGDLPFYVAYDSADVWANPSYFELDKSLNRQIVAGVPPDAFNAEGQIWGMPIYNWNKLAETGYGWWVRRLEKNMELFDLLRLDHFRAFHTYWVIDAAEKTAKNGKWINGPGLSFFETLKTHFKKMPFIAEDLGGDMEDPIKLREEVKLAGMKVLQFGFGADMAQSVHLPHNYEHHNFVVYTGTHDNNTAKGWYNTELEERSKKRLNLYTGKKVNENNVSQLLIQLAMSSTAKMAIFPMQDLLGLDESSRMNKPATTQINWLWRMQQQELTRARRDWLLQLTETYNRG